MASNSSPDYKALFQQQSESPRQSGEARKQAEEARQQAEEARQQAEEARQQAEEARKQAEDQVKRTTFVELLRHCHDLLSRLLQVGSLSSSTTGTIPLPKGKYCPTRLEQWVDCAAQQQDIYDSVRRYLQPEENPPRIFPSRERLKGHLISFPQLITSETDIQFYERIAVDSYVRAVIMELCKIPAAREEFGLGDEVWFDRVPNVPSGNEMGMNNSSNTAHSRPDQSFIHRVDDRAATLLTKVEYVPPRKLTLEDLRVGLGDMDLWEKMVRANKVLNNDADRSVYKAQRLVCSAIVHEYHVMIQKGLEYSYLTTGNALVLLWVPREKPSTLHYHLCVPNQEVDGRDGDLPQPNTSIARVLCLCLMSFRSRQRGQEWRTLYCSELHTWKTNSDRTHANVPTEKLPRNLPSDITDHVSPESDPTSPEDDKSSSPIESPTTPARRVPTRSQGNCAPLDPKDRMGSADSSGSESDPAAPAQDPAAAARKRGYSQVEHSPSQRLSPRNPVERQYELSRRRDAQFCTQRCLLGLQKGGPLDDSCPNVDLHRQGGNGTEHSISTVELISLLKQQMDEDIDRAPFKLTCSPHGYTVVGKGTTKNLWTKAVSHEADIYHILRKAQGSAVPVFLGKIDLVKIYFRCGVEIRHLLVMGWAGESTATLEQTSDLRREIKRSNKEIRALGVRHRDLRPNNILWNAELGWALIIDFHRSELDRRRPADRSRPLKRSRHKAEISESK
ncbi:uncharacterized protein N7515_007252 [Penicillium bovifimosum]|uniref:Protein kinase domain-containing protein n=1 Tax=Penicillium bovifimosum TaxID=126998 RepID=A0A9W9GWK8_9EURO|nr:uncharacterized protein N7515_007252 [Penicillium bovifimosum]KAJ5131213.1 hypothetical protein N7515_007252 [Penicillium bovifimosum]